ncbi:MAG: hypothetical protein A2Y62_03335 [Candidatus Fischerbacteria bacterium RBG_13_37_8]|uniref:Uncharacterized protein n=1 Tax=Candidatus Fischerbacteria bacterium RBG_13_37_8 TaxID=1817863 RepID=A0A1F5VKB1_9BACT|nr:MAG: hypothetical protein A2Y62_03335 [Candidatus Fischerbacteria bacterium RBG_13_37_8]
MGSKFLGKFLNPPFVLSDKWRGKKKMFLLAELLPIGLLCLMLLVNHAYGEESCSTYYCLQKTTINASGQT